LSGRKRGSSGVNSAKPLVAGERVGMFTATGLWELRKSEDRDGRTTKRSWSQLKCVCGKVTWKQTKEAKRAHKEKDPERPMNCGCVLYRDDDKTLTAKAVVSGAVSGRRRKVTLTVEERYTLSQKNCYYCGDPPALTVKRNGKVLVTKRNGIDRVDNSLGYVSGNCISCCKACNWMKGTKTVKQFIEHLTRIEQHSRKEPHKKT
jgi:hypothetical protein